MNHSLSLEHHSQTRLWQIAGVLVLAVFGLNIFLFQNTWAFVWSEWMNSGDYGYGLLIFPVSLYLVWEKRNLLNQTVPNPSGLALVAMGAAALIWVAATILSIQSIQVLLLFAFFILSVFAIVGLNIGKLILFPLLFLFVAAPVWGPISEPLQQLTAVASYKMLRMFSVPALLEGHFITIPNGRFAVEDVCAGLRFFLVSVVLGLLYAYLAAKSWLQRVLFVLVALVMAIVVNWVRVFLIIISGHYFGMDHWMVSQHVTFGWVLYSVVLGVVFLIVTRFVTMNESDRSQTQSFEISTLKLSGLLLHGAAVGGILLFTLGVMTVLTPNVSDNTVYRFDPATLNAGQVLKTDSQDWSPQYPTSDAQYLESFEFDDATITVFKAFYIFQRQGAELISSDNRLYNQSGWKKVTQQTVALGDQLPQVTQIRLEGLNDKNRIIWRWYNIGGVEVSSGMEAKWRQLTATLVGEPRASITALSIVESDEYSAQDVLKQFIQQNYSGLKALEPLEEKI